MGGRGGTSGFTVHKDKNGFADYDSADYHNLHSGAKYYQQQNLGIDARMACMDYVNPNAVPGSLYNMSQNMNYNIANDIPLDAQQQFVYNSINGAAHNLGYNVNLTRYDHGDSLDAILATQGIVGGHDGMSLAQLKTALVGVQYSDARLLSTTYNNFKNAANASTFTSREVKFSYKAKAGAQVVMPMKGTGGNLGEVISASSNHYKIVDVKFTGATARAKGTQSYSKQQIELVVEMW